MKQLSGELIISEVEMHRRESCKHYDDCLNKAVAGKWKSFSCLGCVDCELEVVVVEVYADAASEPPAPGKGNMSGLGRLLTEKMIKFGIQTDAGGKKWGWGSLPGMKPEKKRRMK